MKRIHWISAAVVLLTIAVVVAALAATNHRRMGEVRNVLNTYLSTSYTDRTLFDITTMDTDALSETVLHIAAYHGTVHPLTEDGRLMKEELLDNITALVGGNFLKLMTDYTSVDPYFNEAGAYYIFPTHEKEPTLHPSIQSLSRAGKGQYTAQILWTTETGESVGHVAFTFDFAESKIIYVSVKSLDGGLV